MGFLDKAKAQASTLAAKAQDGINQGQAKMNAASANSAAKGFYEQLGAWTWAQRQGRDEGQADEQIQRILTELEAHEAANGPLALPGIPGAAPPPPGDAATPPPAPAAAAQPVAAPPPPSNIAPPPPPTD